MKNIFTLLPILVVLVGCKKSDLVEMPDQSESSDVTFNTTFDGVTKAVADVNFDTYGIYIAGYHTTGTMLEAVTRNVNSVYPNVFNADPLDNQASVPLVKKQTSGANIGKYVTKTVKLGLDQNTCLGYYSWSQNKVQDAQSGIVGATKDANNKGYPWLDIKNADLLASQVDIVAARSVDKINDRVISAVDLNFEHILSKLTFSLTSSSKINIAFSRVDLVYGTNKVYSRGKYTFNSDPAQSIGTFGSYSEYHSGTNSLGAITLTNNGAPTKVGEMLLVPQKVETGFVVLKLDYRIPNGSTYTNQTRSIQIPATDLISGGNQMFTIDITLDNISVRKSLIDFWNTQSDMLPMIMGPRSEVLLQLDAYDQPYEHIDGKFYWIDRSGYNRHVMLSSGYKGWNETEHYYDFATLQGSGIGGEIPALGSWSDISISIIVEPGTTTSVSNSIPIKLFNTAASTPAIWVSVGTNNSNIVSMSRGDGLGVNTVSSTPKDVRAKKMWVFQFAPTVNHFYDNYIYTIAQNYTGSAVVGSLIRGQLAIEGFVGKIMSVKITRRITTPSEVGDDFKIANRRFGVDLPAPTGATLIGNFAGKLVNKSVGNETWYYYDRNLYVNSSDEGTKAWGPTGTSTSVVDKLSGRTNTKILYNLGSGYAAATTCYSKITSPYQLGSWYLPAQNQLISFWIAKAAFNFTGTSYQSSTEYGPDEGYAVSLVDGSTKSVNKATANMVRCVSDMSIIGNPAVKVIRELGGYVSVDVQSMDSRTWSATTLNINHAEINPTNTLYKRFGVAGSDGGQKSWADAKAYCTSLGVGWRLATQRELMLMWILKDALVGAGVSEFAKDCYWSSTEYNMIGNSNSWNVNFSNGNTTRESSKSNNYYVRCIREI